MDGRPQGAASPRLDDVTKTVGWRAKHWLTCGEASVTYRSQASCERVRGGSSSEEEKIRVAAARAKGHVRRYCKSNGLFRLLTLTYAVQTDDGGQVVRDVHAFVRRVRAEVWGGRARPYCWVPERHQSGMLHVHIALPGYVSKSTLARLWGHGFVDVRMLRGPEREVTSKVAGYLAKYVTKTYSDQGLSGRHRYDVARGFQPAAEVFPADSEGDAWALLVAAEGGSLPVFVWSSDSVEGWHGGPVRVAYW